MKKVLVIPSNRGDRLKEFFDAWCAPMGDWDRVIVIEDNPYRTFDLPPSCDHYSWEEIEATLGDSAWIISRRDSAIRCFGFLMAYRGGADLIVTLDDDCYPREPGICAGHLRAMGSHGRWVESVPGMRTRGLPYFNRGRLDVAANMGLWSRVPDLDAPQTLAGGVGDFEPPRGSRIVPTGQYTPLCGMNLAFRREATPLFYFPPMGEGQPYRRFDDIWAGVIAKRVIDHLGWRLSAGDPAIEHIRASDPMANLVKEAPGIARNETLWQEIDAVRLTADDPACCMAELGDALERDGSDDYARRLGRAMQVWASLFQDPKGSAKPRESMASGTSTLDLRPDFDAVLARALARHGEWVLGLLPAGGCCRAVASNRLFIRRYAAGSPAPGECWTFFEHLDLIDEELARMGIRDHPRCDDQDCHPCRSLIVTFVAYAQAECPSSWLQFAPTSP